jgi:hypothetical protein
MSGTTWRRRIIWLREPRSLCAGAVRSLFFDEYGKYPKIKRWKGRKYIKAPNEGLATAAAGLANFQEQNK